AFFGGSKEGKADVCIWLARFANGKWDEPKQVGDGVQKDGSRLATWNPVLFAARDGLLMLFYKVGSSPSQWWGMIRRSNDDGLTWSDARRLPAGILGPAKNKPMQLASGDIVSP